MPCGRRLFAGAEGALAGKAVEVVTTEDEPRIPGGELFAQSSHFAKAAGRKLRDADVPVDEVDEENFAAAFGGVLNPYAELGLAHQRRTQRFTTRAAFK